MRVSMAVKTLDSNSSQIVKSINRKELQKHAMRDEF